MSSPDNFNKKLMLAGSSTEPLALIQSVPLFFRLLSCLYNRKRALWATVERVSVIHVALSTSVLSLELRPLKTDQQILHSLISPAC